MGQQVHESHEKSIVTLSTDEISIKSIQSASSSMFVATSSHAPVSASNTALVHGVECGKLSHIFAHIVNVLIIACWY